MNENETRNEKVNDSRNEKINEKIKLKREEEKERDLHRVKMGGKPAGVCSHRWKAIDKIKSKTRIVYLERCRWCAEARSVRFDVDITSESVYSRRTISKLSPRLDENASTNQPNESS